MIPINVSVAICQLPIFQLFSFEKKSIEFYEKGMQIYNCNPKHNTSTK